MRQDLLLAALLTLFLPLRAAASPAQDLAARFIDVLRRDDLSLLPSLVDEQSCINWRVTTVIDCGTSRSGVSVLVALRADATR